MNRHLGKHLFLGLVLVGCSPGGTASNLVSLIAGADVALSVLLTACSTVLAAAVTPLLTKLIVGSAVNVSGIALCVACAKVVLAPVALGVTLNELVPKLCISVSLLVLHYYARWLDSHLKESFAQISRWTPFASVILVSLICGGVVANNSAMWMASTASGGLSSLPALILLSVIIVSFLLHLFGYMYILYHDSFTLMVLNRADSFYGIWCWLFSTQSFWILRKNCSNNIDRDWYAKLSTGSRSCKEHRR